MTDEADVARHYSSGSLMSRIRDGLKKTGALPPLNPDFLAPVDEFHIGGREETEPFIKSLGLSPGQCVLDLGCGIGGPARFTERSTGAAVVGVDITSEFVRTAQELTTMTDQSDRVKFVRGSVLDLPFTPGLFDAAYMMHVGMNVADKHRIAREAARVLKPGSIFGIYDIMRVAEGDLTYPVPWATSPSQSSVVHPDRYHFVLESAGFEVIDQKNRAEFALKFYEDYLSQEPEHDNETMTKSDPLGLHLIMGEDAHRKIFNMVQCIRNRLIAPMITLARLPDT